MLAALDTTGTDTDLIDEITALDQLTTAISARQARLTDAFATRHRARLIENGMSTADARRSVCAQIALPAGQPAQRQPPRRPGPHPRPRNAADPAGDGTRRRQRMAGHPHRPGNRPPQHPGPRPIDAALAPHLAGWSDTHTTHQARAWAHRLDPHGAADRARKAATDRRVTIRPAPDCMTYLTALLPMKEASASTAPCTAPP